MKTNTNRIRSILVILICTLFLTLGLGVLAPSTAKAEVTATASNWVQMKQIFTWKGDITINVQSDMTVISGNLHNTGSNFVIDLNGHTIDANNQQVFWNEKGTLTIKNGTIKNAYSDIGGAINNRGTLILENVNIKNCSAKQGGGILNYGTMTMTGGSIENCQAGRGGGLRILPHDSDKSAIAQSATAYLTNVRISGNLADGRSNFGRGGGISVSSGNLTMTDCKLTNNKSTNDDGGGLDFDSPSGYLLLKDTEISGNSVTKGDRQGGGINLERGNAEIRNCIISGNSAEDGGGIFLYEDFGTATIYGTTIKNNTSTFFGGGGICNHATLQVLENSVISGNTSKAGGAGIWSNKYLQVKDSTVSGNISQNSDADGGGIHVSRGNAVLESVTVKDNQASDGGGIHVAGGAVATISGTSVITGNKVKHSGGGIMVKGSLTLEDTFTITGNTCEENGGAIYFNGSVLRMKGKAVIKDNNWNNLFLFTGKRINVNGKLDESSVIYVSPGSATTPVTSGFTSNGNSKEKIFVHDHGQSVVKENGEVRIIYNTVPGDVFDRVTVRIHPKGQNSALNIRDNGRGAGQNVVQLFNTGDSCRFWLTKADDNSYYIDYFDGADDYSPSTKRFDLSDKNGYGNSGNVVHVVKGNSTATNKRWMFIQNEDGTYYIQNKRSGLFWDLENDNFDNKNKLCQRSLQDAQKWEVEIVAADGKFNMNYLKPYDSYSFMSDGELVTASNWMSRLPDELRITDLSIPGTHDAGAAHTSTCNSSAQCQQLSIYDQLYSGIRYLDLRIGPDLRIVHKSTNCQFNGDQLYLDRVMGWIRQFLKDNPREVVILQPMQNRGGNKVEKAAYNYFKDLVAKERDLFYIGDHVPSLGECRGKIVIISRLDYSNNDYKTTGGQWALEARNWQESRIDHQYYDDEEYLRTFDFTYKNYTDTDKRASGLVASGSDYEIWSQDDYKKVGDSKWELIYNSIFDDQTGAQAKYNWWNRAKQNKFLWLVSYTSCTSFAAPVKYPQAAARELNPKLKNKLWSETSLSNGRFLGVVCSDFSDEQLAYLVYRQNFAMSHAIIRGIGADGTEPFQPLVFNVAKNQPLNETLGLKKDEIDLYFTRGNYATHDYSTKDSTNALCNTPMSQLKNEEEYEAATVDISKLQGGNSYTLYLGVDRKMNTTQNVLFEAPNCLTEVTGTDWSGQTPRPVFKEAENAHYHIAEENGKQKAYWVTNDKGDTAFTGKLESGKNYIAKVELEADWGHCFATDWSSINFHIKSSDGRSEDTSTFTNFKLFPRTVTAVFTKAAVSHNLTHEEAKAATCTESGQVENYYCSVCNRHFADEAATTVLSEEEVTIAALGHTPQEPKEENRIEPSCTEAGSVELVSRCSVCGEAVNSRTQTLPALGHHWDSGTVTTAATCTQPGVKTFTCQNDSSHTYTETLPATGHSFGAWTTAGEGKEQRICSNDPSHIQTRKALAPDHVHSMVHIAAKAATCESDGNSEYWICSGTEDSCGRYYADAEGLKEIDPDTIVIKAIGHAWNEGIVTTEPGCTSSGTRTYTCKHDSSHTKTESISPIGHKAGEWVDEVIHEATCMHGKYEWHTLYCGNGCGEILTMQLRKVSDPLEHKWGETEYIWAEDNSTVTAKRVCTCDPENPHVETETVQVTEEVEIPVTCEQAGKTRLTATFKNPAFAEQKKDVEIPALEHKWDQGEVTKKVTCMEAGEKTYTCLNDATHKRTEVIKPSGHLIGVHTLEDTDTATCTKGGTCTVETVCLVCKEVIATEQVETPALGHDWGEETYTMSSDGKSMTASHTCLVCGETESETVSVTFEDYYYYSEAFENPFFQIQEIPVGEGDGNSEQEGVVWTKGSSESAIFDAYFLHKSPEETDTLEFLGIEIDGEQVPESEYIHTIEPGTIEGQEIHIVEIHVSTLEKLSVGSHTVTARYLYEGQEKTLSDTLEVLDPNETHTHHLTHVPSKNATCTEDGNIEYWVCDQGNGACGKYFADPELTIEISKEETVIKAHGHIWGEWAVTGDGVEMRTCLCDSSHFETKDGSKVNPDINSNQNTKGGSKKAAKTGDENNITLWLALIAGSLAIMVGTGVVIGRKRRRDK